MINSIQRVVSQKNDTVKANRAAHQKAFDCGDFSSQRDSVSRAQTSYGKAQIAFCGKSYEELVVLQRRVNKMKSSYRMPLFNVLNNPSFALTKPLEKTLDGIGGLFTYITQNQQKPLEFLQSVAKNHQVVMLGEEHTSLSSKTFAASAIPEFKKQGYNYAAVEVDAKYQADVDDFLSGKIDDKELLQRDKEKTSGGVIGNSCGMGFLKTCKEQGVKVVCADDTEQFLLESLGYLSDPETINNKMYSRDGRILRNLEKRVFDKDKDAKVLIYIGENHTFKDKVGNDSNLSLRMQLDQKLGQGKVSSISLSEPDSLNLFADIPKISTGVAFSTDSKDLDGLVKQEPFLRILYEPGYVYYNRHIDGMVIVDDSRHLSSR